MTVKVLFLMPKLEIFTEEWNGKINMCINSDEKWIDQNVKIV